MVRVETIINLMEDLAPRRRAMEWDNVGLQTGHPAWEVKRIMVALDASEAAIAQAEASGCQLLLVHHPLIFKPQSHLREDLPLGRKLARLVGARIALYVAHTNLDVAEGGVSDVLARRLGLVDLEVLSAMAEEGYYKLVVFVPQGHEEKVRQALAEAGAGWIGNYSHCTFQTAGTGTFKPLEGANPFLGEVGTLEYAQEYRLETILPKNISARVIRAMLRAHPYEEAAYDLFPLANEGRPYGLGRVGRLENSLTLAELAQKIRTALGARTLRVMGDGRRSITRVAVLGGSGEDFVDKALFAGADVLVTGDVGYHRAREAQDKGLAVIDAGHWATEAPVVSFLAGWLRQRLLGLKETVEVLTWEKCEDPFTDLTGSRGESGTGENAPVLPPGSGGATGEQRFPTLVLHTDGASRGNPGPAGIGVLIQDQEGNIIKEIGEFVGQTTNNAAEYQALIRGLREAHSLGARVVEALADSELMVRQVKGEYRVTNQGLSALCGEVRDLIRGLDRFSIRHIPREKNAQADRLANQGIDRGQNKE
ncbi:MAG: Nif3-like dinuclear metal center hexameric protein [Firmicutes bacterium]|nr:Nif3-like dinuclear metal center hexameric protein [Bacillota bacterium]